MGLLLIDAWICNGFGLDPVLSDPEGIKPDWVGSSLPHLVRSSANPAATLVGRRSLPEDRNFALGFDGPLSAFRRAPIQTGRGEFSP